VNHSNKTFLSGAIYLSLAASIWGGMYVFSKYVLEFIPPFTLLFLRYLVAGLVLGWLHRRQGGPWLPPVQRGLLFQIGLVGYFLSIAAQFIGTHLSSAHMGALVTTLSPLFMSLFAIVLLKEPMLNRQKLAMGLAVIGMLIVVGLPAKDEAGQAVWLGNLTLLLAAIFWGYYSVRVQQATHYYPALQITTWAIWLAAGLTLPITWLEHAQWSLESALTWPVILGVLYIGVISTAVAFFSWNKGLSLMSAHQAGPFLFLQPVVGSLLGWLILDEALTLSFFTGSALIMIAVYLVLSSQKQAASPNSEAAFSTQQIEH
jgi:drug/metabolite transporter (DMT)-like permease